MSAVTTRFGSNVSAGGSAVVLIGRILLSAMFIMGGYAKLTAVSGTAQWFASLGIPMPTVVVVASGLIELIGGLAVLVGFQTRIAALVLAIFTIAATLIAHMELSDMTQMLFFQKNLGIAGGFLILSVFGPGAWSLDGRR